MVDNNISNFVEKIEANMPTNFDQDDMNYFDPIEVQDY